MTELYDSNVKSTTGAVTNMNIEVNASMFKLLSKNVYNDPIAAVIREWSTNAIDISIANNLPINFDVQVPSNSNLTFSVRDYGTGLSDEDVKGLFSTFGSSTKRNDDNQNGTFGIGRMAGLAYASAFIVESFYKGTHSIYTVSISDGIPVTIHLSSAPTTEPDGLKLSLSVEPEDVRTFRETMARIYYFFSTKPNLSEPLPITRDSSKDLATDWFIDHKYTSQRNYILMSNVLYEIPYHSELRGHGFSNLVIKVPNNAVSFNPGRETINLSSESIKFLNDRFEKVFQDYKNKVVEAIKDQPSDIDKISTYTKYTRSAPYSIRSSLDVVPYLSDNLTSLLTSRNRWANTEAFQTLYGNALELRYKSSYVKLARKLENEYISQDNFVNSSYLIIDQKTNFQHAIKAQEQDTIVLVRKDNTSLEDFLPQAKKFLSDIGVSKYLLSSSYEITKEEKEKIIREGVHVCSYSNGSFRRSKKASSDTLYWYVPLVGSNPDWKESKSFESYYKLYNLLSIIDSNTPPLVGIQKKYIDEAKENSNFVPFNTAVLSHIKKYDIKVIEDDVDNFPLRSFKGINTMPDIIKKCVEVAASVKDTKFKVNERYTDLLDYFCIPYTKVSLPISKKKLFSRYPLLPVHMRDYTTSQLPHYLKLEYHYDSIHRANQESTHRNFKRTSI